MKLNNKGQVAVEYILMIAVVVAMVTSLLAIIKRKYLGDVTQCARTDTKTLACRLNAIIAYDGGGNKRFQYYPMKK